MAGFLSIYIHIHKYAYYFSIYIFFKRFFPTKFNFFTLGSGKITCPDIVLMKPEQEVRNGTPSLAGPFCVLYADWISLWLLSSSSLQINYPVSIYIHQESE